MRLKPLFVLGLLMLAFSGHAFGQVVLPWATSEQPKGPEPEQISESQLPLVRARMQRTAEVWVGQAVPFIVEVIVPTWFTAAPKFPEIEVPNAVTLSPEAATNFVVQSAGKTFSAQSQRYLIFPQVKGKYTVPSVKVETTYALPDGKPSAPAVLSSSSLIFEARVPAGAEGAKYFLTTDNFQISQSLDRKLQDLKVSDSIIRTVTMTAENTAGMTLPPLSFEAPDGIRVYVGVPKVSEKAERGKVEAARVETVTYVLEKEGSYKLPEILILWWDPQAKKMNRALLPAIEINVEKNPGANAEVFASSQEIEKQSSDESERTLRDRLKAVLHWVLMVFGLFLLFLVIRRILSFKGISIRAYLTERRQRASAEITYFKRFRKASLCGDPRTCLRELMAWLDRTNTRPVAPTLDQFARESGMPSLLREETALKALLFGRPEKAEPAEKWSGRSFYRLVAQARRTEIRENKKLIQGEEKMLSLNPPEAGRLRRNI